MRLSRARRTFWRSCKQEVMSSHFFSTSYFYNNKSIGYKDFPQLRFMRRRVDYERMYRDLQRLQGILADEISEINNGENLSVEITVGRRPPRVYATFGFVSPDEVEERGDGSLTLVSEIERHQHYSTLAEAMKKVAEVMAKHELISYPRRPSPSYPFFPQHAFGFPHKKYTMQDL